MSERLADLIARVEKATGPDREIDCLVYGALHFGDKPWRAVHLGEQGRLAETNWRWVVIRPTVPPYEIYLEPPAYTGSLEAAKLTAPEGTWSVTVFHEKTYATAGSNAGAGSYGPTPPLALLLASLKARNLKE